MNTYFRISATRCSVSSCGPYTEFTSSKTGSAVRASEQADYLVSQGWDNVFVEDWSDCAACGHGKSEHFESKGVCDLGFCRKDCSTYVAP